MTLLVLGLLSALAATNQIAGSSPKNKPFQGAPSAISESNDPIEVEYRHLLAADDAAQEEADQWIRNPGTTTGSESSVSRVTLKSRIEQRFAPVRKAYEDFISRHPKQVRARIAYASFLNDTSEEEEAVEQLEKAKDIEPENPVIWNNLANHYGHRGPIERAFQYYERAHELAPGEPLYLHNLATTTYLFRKDAMERYQINETQVFDKALDLYRRALKLDPKNFPLATDLAQSYYGIKPLRTDEALAAWEEALRVANDAIEREGVYLHMARVELNSGRFAEARKHLGIVTNGMYATLKSRLLRNVADRETKTPKAGGITPDSIREKQ